VKDMRISIWRGIVGVAGGLGAPYLLMRGYIWLGAALFIVAVLLVGFWPFKETNLRLSKTNPDQSKTTPDK